MREEDNNNNGNNQNNQDYKIDFEDHTKEFTPEEIKSGKAMSILAYISILCLIPFFMEKKNRYVVFNAKQGLNLFIYEAILYMIDSVTSSFMPALSFLAYFCELLLIVYSLVGIIYVVSNQARELPFLKRISFIK
jgi:uncharacterized membrane protein